MSNSDLAAVVTPIVMAIVLAGWIAAIFHADAHPRYGHRGSGPRTEVAGGAFRALGGRQVMPHPDAGPASVPAPRSAENETTAGSGEAQTAGSAVPGPRPAEPAPSQPGGQAVEGTSSHADVASGSGLERGASATSPPSRPRRR